MLNENIKAIRRSKGLSQQELAVKLMENLGAVQAEGEAASPAA